MPCSDALALERIENEREMIINNLYKKFLDEAIEILQQNKMVSENILSAEFLDYIEKQTTLTKQKLAKDLFSLNNDQLEKVKSLINTFKK